MKIIPTICLLFLSVFCVSYVSAQKLKLKVEVTQTLMMNEHKTVFFDALKVLSDTLEEPRVRIEFSEELTSAHAFKMGEKYVVTFVKVVESKDIDQLHVIKGNKISMGAPTLWSVESVMFEIDGSVRECKLNSVC